MADQCMIVSAKRSPVGKYLGALSEMEPLDLAVQVAEAALTAAGKSIGKEIDQIFVGNCIPSAFETGSVVGRQIGLKLGLDVFTTTIDTACCSPLTALRMAVWGMRLGELEAALIIGVESMSRVPHFTKELRTGVRLGEVRLTDPIYPISYPGYQPVAVDASDGAEKYAVPRRMLDSFAMGSHLKWAAALRPADSMMKSSRSKSANEKRTIYSTRTKCPGPKAVWRRSACCPPFSGRKTQPRVTLRV